MSRRNNPTKYASVPTQDPESLENPNYEYKPRTKDEGSPLIEKIIGVVHSLFWIALAAGTWYYTDLIHVHSNPRVRSTSLAVAMLLGFIATAAFLYLYIDNFRRGSPNQDYFEEYPKTVYVLTFSGLLFWVMVCVALFPVFGWKSIILVSINFMGFIMAVSLLSI